MSKLIKAVFAGRFCRTHRVFQFDTDDKLQIVNVDLPASFTVDFSNSKTGDSVPVLATSDTVQIPPNLFIPGSEIYAWIWLSDSNGGHTRCEATIPIDPRARRTGTEPTPAQASAWDEAVDTLNEAAADYTDAMRHAPAIIDGYWYVWDADAGEYVNTNVKAEGRDGDPGDPGADGNNAWTVDAQYVRTAGGVIQAQTQRLVGPPDATVKVGDIVFVSDGRFADVTATNALATRLSVVGNLRGDPGEDGFAPEVTIEQIEGGHRVTITSAAHPEGQSFDVMDGSGGGGVTVDDEISGTSENPVQNKVIKAALDGKLGTSGDGSNVTVAFTAAAQRTAIATGEKLSVLFGKIRKWLSDLGTAAFRAATGSITQNSTDLVESGAVYTALAAKGTYSKPSGGIPKTDLASAVQTSLGKADTALQSYTETDPTVPSWAKAPNKPSYTASDVGAVAVAQGVAHAGEFVVVGPDGNITTVTMSVWQGGSF